MHVVQRGNDRCACFFSARDFAAYLSALRAASTHYGVRVHAYALMTNHVHLLVTPPAAEALSRMMQSLGARYVRRINDARERTGTLWEGRYKACLVEHDSHVLAACRYIDLNPVRAGMVSHPAAYRWSSYRALAGLEYDAWLVVHPVLAQLLNAPGNGYARWCAQGASGAEIAQLREATERELAFGTEQFKCRIELATSRRASPVRRGRRPASGRALQL